jgi:hypothetical protein
MKTATNSTTPKIFSFLKKSSPVHRSANDVNQNSTIFFCINAKESHSPVILVLHRRHTFAEGGRSNPQFGHLIPVFLFSVRAPRSALKVTSSPVLPTSLPGLVPSFVAKASFTSFLNST